VIGVLLALAFLAVWFGNLDARKLAKSDEGRYAEISREMYATGDWVTPRLNAIKYFEKPPLHYWASAAAFSAFGLHEWTARFWSALTGLFGVVFALFLGRRLFGPVAGEYAAVVLASSLMYTYVAHVDTLDMGLTFFLFVAFGAFMLAQRDGATARDNRLWMHVAWAAMALAVLTKGLAGVVLPGIALVLYTLLERDWRLWTRLHIASGSLLFLLIVAPWFVLVSMRNPEFPWFFFVHEHFLRFTTKIHHRDEPWWYFVPMLLAGTLPWVLTVLDAVWRSARRDVRIGFQARRFLLVWAVGIFLFFSASGSKLPSYILPIIPALAMLAGWRLTTLGSHALLRQIAPIGVLALVALAALPFIHTSGDTPTSVIAAFKGWVLAAMVVFLVGTGYALWCCRRDRIPRAVLATAVAALLCQQILITGTEELSPSTSAGHVAQKVLPHLRPGVPFYSVGTYDQTLDFYLDRTVTLVEYRDEMDFGLQQEPQLAIPTIAQWEEVWRRQPYALAHVRPDVYQELRAKNFPMVLIADDGRRYFIKTP
jgi:4-amino-4-deoxy-L-arabinose transferase-like glycosyltransferase